MLAVQSWPVRIALEVEFYCLTELELTHLGAGVANLKSSYGPER